MTEFVRGTRMRVCFAGVAAALVVATLAGCTAADSTPSGSPAATARSAAAKMSSSSPSPNALPGRGVYSGLKMDGCSTSAGDVSASGTMTLPKGKAGDVTVTVSWVDSKTNAVAANGKTVLTGLKSGEAKPWRIDTKLPAQQGTVICVPGATLN